MFKTVFYIILICLLLTMHFIFLMVPKLIFMLSSKVLVSLKVFFIEIILIYDKEKSVLIVFVSLNLIKFK